jgi:hypothetical protein
MQNKTIEQAIQLVSTSPSSIFSKEDVIGIIKTIKPDENNIGVIIDEILSKISVVVDNLECKDVIDEQSAEFSISDGNRIEFEIADVEHNNIYEKIEEEILKLKSY